MQHIYFLINDMHKMILCPIDSDDFDNPQYRWIKWARFGEDITTRFDTVKDAIECAEKKGHTIYYEDHPLTSKKGPTTGEGIVKDDYFYYNMLTYAGGNRFSIPMLLSSAPNYQEMYIYYMRLRETHPDSFRRVLNWD